MNFKKTKIYIVTIMMIASLAMPAYADENEVVLGIASDISEFSNQKSSTITVETAKENASEKASTQKQSSTDKVISVGSGPNTDKSSSISLSGPGFGLTINNTAVRSGIVAYAKQFLGNPYVFGGTSLTDGIDCSAFVQQVYKKYGINVSRTSRDQYAQCKKISASQLQPGDLVFYAYDDGYIHHVAMYIGNGQIIHAKGVDSGIVITNMDFETVYACGTLFS